MGGGRAQRLWTAFGGMFSSLPEYKARYKPGFEPVCAIRAGQSKYAFVQLADAVLASTAVALETMWVGSRQATRMAVGASHSGMLRLGSACVCVCGREGE